MWDYLKGAPQNFNFFDFMTRQKLNLLAVRPKGTQTSTNEVST
jgi:hypothetical protein